MRNIKQLNNGRWQISVGYDEYPTLPLHVATAILWRSYATAQEAFADAVKLFTPHHIAAR